MDGFEAFGQPVPDYRRDEAYRQTREMGLTSEQAFEAVGKIARAIEDDRPHLALGPTTDLALDLTGRYRVMAVLCAHENRARCVQPEDDEGVK